MRQSVLQFIFIVSSVWCLLGILEVSPCIFTLSPNKMSRILVGDFYWVTINCTCCHANDEANLTDSLQLTLNESNSNPPGGLFLLRVVSYNRHIAQPSRINYRRSHADHEECRLAQEYMCSAQDYGLPLGSRQGFYVEANQVGRARFNASIAWWNASKIEVDRKGNKAPPTAVIAWDDLGITIVRKQRRFYTIFDYSAVFIACMTALTVGCCTDSTELKRNLKSPMALVTAVICQHIFMPLLALAVNFVTGLPNDLAYGLFATCTLPGGGLAHLIVFLMDGDRAVSTAVSLINTILDTGVSAIWLIGFGWYFHISIRVHLYILWLLPGLVAHVAGVILRHLRPIVADAVMTWFTRPILLLSGILLITLGVYINHYAFHYIDYNLVFALILTIFGGFCLGGLAGYATKRDKPVRKALAAETSVFNCLLIIPALRHALDQPEADLAATVPLWGVFFTPAPILLYFVAHKVKNTTLRFIERRKEKQYRHYSIVSSLGKMAQEVGAVSAQVAKDENHSPKLGLSTPPPPTMIEKQEKTTSL